VVAVMRRYLRLARALRRCRCESGAELVEFALVLPLLLVLIAGITDFTMLFQSYEVTTNAAREGARLAVLPGYAFNNYATVRTRVANYLAAGGAVGSFQTNVAPVTLTLGNGFQASGVQVTVTYTHSFLFIGPIVGLINGTFMNTLTYRTTAQMRTEVQTVFGP
jgi:Flp pilus assembly protein TadG